MSRPESCKIDHCNPITTTLTRARELTERKRFNNDTTSGKIYSSRKCGRSTQYRNLHGFVDRRVYRHDLDYATDLTLGVSLLYRFPDIRSQRRIVVADPSH